MKFEEDYYPKEFMMTTPGVEYPRPERICTRCLIGYSGQEECPKCGRKNEKTIIIY